MVAVALAIKLEDGCAHRAVRQERSAWGADVSVAEIPQHEGDAESAAQLSGRKRTIPVTRVGAIIRALRIDELQSHQRAARRYEFVVRARTPAVRR